MNALNYNNLRYVAYIIFSGVRYVHTSMLYQSVGIGAILATHTEMAAISILVIPFTITTPLLFNHYVYNKLEYFTLLLQDQFYWKTNLMAYNILIQHYHFKFKCTDIYVKL